MNFLRGLTTTSSPSNAKAEAAGAPSNNDLGGFDPNSPTHKKKMSLDDGLDDEREEVLGKINANRVAPAGDENKVLILDENQMVSGTAKGTSSSSSSASSATSVESSEGGSRSGSQEPLTAQQDSMMMSALSTTAGGGTTPTTTTLQQNKSGKSSASSSSADVNISVSSVVSDPQMQELPPFKNTSTLRSPTVFRNLLLEDHGESSSGGGAVRVSDRSSGSTTIGGMTSGSSPSPPPAPGSDQHIRSTTGSSFVTPPAADSEHGGPARFSLTDSDAPFYSSSLPRGGSAPRNQLQFSSSQLSPQLLNDYNEGAATLFSETEENIDLEESHEDMFSEWRFELAGQLAEQPDLLQKMMQFMERIQRENKTLKQEKQQQMGRVNELLRDASDNLCKQVNDFLAEKEQQRQTELRNLRGSSKSSSSPSRGEAEGAPSDSSATVSSRELTEEGAVVGLGGGAAGRSAASAPPTAQNHDPRAKNERRRGVAERLAFFACVFPCIIVYRAFKYFSFLFTLGFFGFEYVVYQRSHSISNADAPPTAASSQLPAMLESYFCPKEGEGVGAPAGEDPDDLCVMSGPNCKFSGLTQYVTARTCKHLEILLLQKATKSPAQEESSQKMMTQQENIKVADVVSETLQTLTGAAPGGDACVPAVQRCADELLSYKHEYHSMMKEYNRATGEYRKAEHSLNMLRIYVTRRGPLLEDPAGCWAQTFTPEICCSPWYGPTGHPGCWDGVVTFEKCCTLYRTTDVISRHAGHATNALPKR